jgi:dihydrofolate reductase
VFRSNLALVAALDRNRLIGARGAMPWHLPEDLRHFKQLTLGAPVIQGRKTYESIVAQLGRPLPGRRNIVITRRTVSAARGVEFCDSLDAALALAGVASPVFVIGGGEIYREAIAHAARLHLTEIDAAFEGDTWFPEIDPKSWRETGRDWHVQAGPQPLRYAFVTYDRIRAQA